MTDDRDFARHVAEEIGEGSICAKCIATSRGFTRNAVEAAIVSLRLVLVIDSTAPCRVCGTRESLALAPPGR